jgi:hypothetical protein
VFDINLNVNMKNTETPRKKLGKKVTRRTIEISKLKTEIIEEKTLTCGLRRSVSQKTAGVERTKRSALAK